VIGRKATTAETCKAPEPSPLNAIPKTARQATANHSDAGTSHLPRYSCVTGHRFKLPKLTLRHGLGAAVGVVILVAALALVPSQTAAHPQVTRQQAIQAALKYGSGKQYPRVEAKFMRYHDFVRGDTEFNTGTDGPDYFVWVVAVSGDYGISSSGPCCYVPPPTTWGIAVVKDEQGPAQATMFEDGNKGNWPPFFGGLPDLAKDQH
jgi:hypothetical protein